MELCPAENGGNSTAQEHRVEEDKAANRGVGVFAENHERDQPDSRSLELELLGSVVSQRNTDDAKEGVESAHKGVVDLFGVLFARFELERTVVSGEDTRETDKHLSEGGMDVEVVFVLNIVAAELSETKLMSVDSIADWVGGAITGLRPK